MFVSKKMYESDLHIIHHKIADLKEGLDKSIRTIGTTSNLLAEAVGIIKSLNDELNAVRTRLAALENDKK